MPVLGLRGSGSFTVTGQRPENYREKILHLKPNGKAPLTALLAMLKSEKVDDSIFHWYEKETPAQRLRVNGAVNDVATSIIVHATSAANGYVGAYSSRIGKVLLVESTGEVMIVTADPSNDTGLTVGRGKGTTAAAAIADGAYMTIIGTAHEEGGALPSAITYDPTEFSNYTQIFRSSIYMTRTAQRTRLRTGDQVKEAKREALEILSIEKERAFIFGEYGADTGAKGQPRRMTRGLISHINTYNSSNIIDAGGAMSESEWDGYLEQIFRYGSTEKLALCGSGALKVLSTMAKNGGIQINQASNAETYGMRLGQYDCTFGTLFLKSHPLFNEHGAWRDNILIVDTAHIIERYLDDISFLKDRGTRGDDSTADEYLNECGLETHFAKAHGYIKNITSFAP